MKKIVALVLCLALALSLCTVAFAAQVKVDGANAIASKKVDAKAPVYKNDEVKTEGKLAHWFINNNYYVEADTDADTELYFTADKKYVRAELVNDYNVYYEYVATEITDINNDTCGSMIDADENETFVFYTEADGTMVLAKTVTLNSMTQDRVLLNGVVKAVTAVNTTEYTTHAWELVDADDDGKVDATELVKCSECGATSKVYTDDTASIKGAIFEELTDAMVSENHAALAANIYASATYSWMGAGSAGNKTETVESAKTFDAGIAMYAGMALMSVAGSAVVIGKKKEF